MNIKNSILAFSLVSIVVTGPIAASNGSPPLPFPLLPVKTVEEAKAYLQTAEILMKVLKEKYEKNDQRYINAKAIFEEGKFDPTNPEPFKNMVSTRKQSKDSLDEYYEALVNHSMAKERLRMMQGSQ